MIFPELASPTPRSGQLTGLRLRPFIPALPVNNGSSVRPRVCADPLGSGPLRTREASIQCADR